MKTEMLETIDENQLNEVAGGISREQIGKLIELGIATRKEVLTNTFGTLSRVFGSLQSIVAGK
jgi:ribosomal protein L19E